ncbi:MAG: AzlD domain-containing protein [Lachnospiraceae bacterium]|nr:AzlD domain-containing protein [Lachnospiraceae bacterium]
MTGASFWIYLAILAGTTYLVRVIPFVAIKNKIENKYVQSFLYYIPYAVLSAMTIPAVFYSTDTRLGAVAGAVVAVIFALKKKSLTVVAVAACVMVYAVEMIL